MLPENIPCLYGDRLLSRYPEVVKLSSTTSSSVINTLKSIIARHGIPTELVTNNGSQFISREIKHFASIYSFQHITVRYKFLREKILAKWLTAKIGG